MLPATSLPIPGASPALRAPVAPLPTLAARSLALAEVDERFTAAWRTLEARALEGNAYLSPDFLLPVVRHLQPGVPLRVLAVEAEDDGAKRLAALGVFREAPASRRFPLPHLEAHVTKHTYATGLLVDAELAGPALDALFRFATSQGAPWHGVAFADWRSDGALGEAMLRAAEGAGATWHPHFEWRRAALVPERLHARSFETALARISGKDWRKKTLRLLESGELRWRLLSGPECDEAAVERFLALEDRDWTREKGSSLRAAGQAEMFREICGGLCRDGRLFLTEVLFRDEVIASTSNFVSGAEGFAFKLGWSKAHARLKPGLLNDLMFLRARDALAPLRHVDSGTQPGSHVEALWEDRTTLQSGVFSTSRLGHAAATAAGALREVKRTAAAVARTLRPW